MVHAVFWVLLDGVTESIELRVDLASSSNEKIEAISIKASILEVGESASIIFRRIGSNVASTSDIFCRFMLPCCLVLDVLEAEGGSDEATVLFWEGVCLWGFSFTEVGGRGTFCLA